MQNSRELQNEEEAMRKRLILAEIKENAWKRRGEKSSHEEHSDRLKKEEKNEKKDLMKSKLKKLEEGRKSGEEKERERRNKFLEEWRMKVERKQKQERVQKGWKDLLESVEGWEELQEGELENDNLEDWFAEGCKDVWTEENYVVQHIINGQRCYFCLNCEEWICDKARVFDEGFTLLDEAGNLRYNI